jgi:8-oxo-dGTP pyrophosphatase MutT (NUDIX family)
MAREKSAGAIIFIMENGVPHYLLLHYPAMNRKGGHWEFSKGHVEKDETEEETVKREVFEETGINDLKIIPGFKEYIKYFFKKKQTKPFGSSRTGEAGRQDWVFKLVTFFVAETEQKDIQLSPEHIGFVWLPYEPALKKITYKNSKELFKKANEFISKQSF